MGGETPAERRYRGAVVGMGLLIEDLAADGKITLPVRKRLQAAAERLFKETSRLLAEREVERVEKATADRGANLERRG